LPFALIPYFSASLLAVCGDAVLLRQPALVPRPAATAARTEEERIEAEPVAAGRDGNEQAGDQLDQVLVDDPVMPLGLGVGRQARPGRNGEIEQRQEGCRGDGSQRSQEPQDEADADCAEPVRRQPVRHVQEAQRSRIIAVRRLLLRGLQGDDRVGQFLALRDQRCGQLPAVAFERPTHLPGALALIGQRLRIPLGLLDTRQLAQVLLPRLTVVVGVEPDVGPGVALLEQRLRLGLLATSEPVVVRDPLDGLAPARLELSRVEQGQAVGVGQHAAELRSQRTGGVPQVDLGGERLLAVPR